MGNIGGLEVVMVLMIALVVLGPTKLPEAARQVGKVVTEFRRMSGSFQRELREAIQDPIIEAEARARGAMENTMKAVDDAKKAVVDPFQNGATGGSATNGSGTSDSASVEPTPPADATPTGDTDK